MHLPHIQQILQVMKQNLLYAFNQMQHMIKFAFFAVKLQIQ